MMGVDDFFASSIGVVGKLEMDDRCSSQHGTTMKMTCTGSECDWHILESWLGLPQSKYDMGRFMTYGVQIASMNHASPCKIAGRESSS